MEGRYLIGPTGRELLTHLCKPPAACERLVYDTVTRWQCGECKKVYKIRTLPYDSHIPNTVWKRVSWWEQRKWDNNISFGDDS